MKASMIAELIKRRQMKKDDKFKWDDEDENKDDGLSPKMKKAVNSDHLPDSDDELEDDDDDVMKKDPEEILGRKPMSMTKSSRIASGDDDDGGEASDDAADDLGDDDVLDTMTDERVQESLEAGRKPRTLWDRVQMNIAKKRKK